VVIAKSTESRKDFSKEVIYKTAQGLLLRKPGNQENEVQLTVEGFGDQSTEQVTAYYKRKDADGKEVMAGKLNIVSYDKLVERLVIVSVNNTAPNISTTDLAESLNTIFAPAAVTWTVESQSIADVKYDTNGKSGLDDGSSGLFSNYTSEMRTVINAYKDKYDIASHTWYLFLVPNSESGRTQGFMPRKKQAGFIFMEQLGEAPLAKVIAHEIGHGAFRLEHTFNTYNTLEKYSTDNLMDYQPNGITLHKYQWDLIHDPAAVLGLFEEDGEGAMSLPCLGIFDDCDDVIAILKGIKSRMSRIGPSLPIYKPDEAKNRKMLYEGSYIKIDGIEYSKILIKNETTKDEVIDPKVYYDYSEKIGNLNWAGFSFKLSNNSRFSILVNENDIDNTLKKRENLRKYLFGDILPVNNNKSEIPSILSENQLKKLYPKTDDSVLKSIFQYIAEYKDQFGIDNCTKLIHFLSQADHESGGFIYMKEIQVFSDSNREKYKGRGIFQLTFLSNYRAFQEFLSKMNIEVDLVNNPELVEDTKLAVLSALWYWKINNLNQHAQDLTEVSLLNVSKIINCGNLNYCGCEKDSNGDCKLDENKKTVKCEDCEPNGWEDRKLRFTKFKNEIPCEND
jgi:predicted chitinase